jgi:hypothetical protein
MIVRKSVRGQQKIARLHVDLIYTVICFHRQAHRLGHFSRGTSIPFTPGCLRRSKASRLFNKYSKTRLYRPRIKRILAYSGRVFEVPVPLYWFSYKIPRI